MTLESHINKHIAGPVEGNVTRYTGLVDALQISRDVTSGLEYIHQNGEVHRDLKPKNGELSVK